MKLRVLDVLYGRNCIDSVMELCVFGRFDVFVECVGSKDRNSMNGVQTGHFGTDSRDI